MKIKRPRSQGGISSVCIGNGLYAGNAFVKNRAESAYLKIISIRDTDERTIAFEVELEKLDKIATSRLKKSNSRDENVQMQLIS